ncbi:hypothetical protein GCK32_016173, partial [Trichostrongylus colubriformis]
SLTILRPHVPYYSAAIASISVLLEANISEFLQMAEKNAERHNILKKMFSIYQGSKDIVKQITTEGKKKQEPSGLKYGVHQSVKQVKGIDSRELEEFENVSKMRPAIARVRTRELRWKDDPDVDDITVCFNVFIFTSLVKTPVKINALKILKF